MFKFLLGTALGFIVSKSINKNKYWYIKEDETFVKLDTSAIISYLQNDYYKSKETSQYEFLDFIVDFEDLLIKLNNKWYKLYYK